MKNKLFYSCVLMLVEAMLASCEKVVLDDDKQSTAQDGDQLRTVSIRVQEVNDDWHSGTTRSLVNISEVCTKVCFAFYQDGKRVSNKNQSLGDEEFGSLTLKLGEGSYQVLVLGHSGTANPATTKPEKIQFTNPGASDGTGFTDTFYYYGDLVVGEDDIRLDISMKRATSMFRLVTTDAKPANVKKFHFYYTGGSGALDATTGLGCVKSQQTVIVETDDSQAGQQLQFDLYTFLHAETGEVDFTVKALDANDAIVCEKKFEKVSMKRNCITRYTGAFFTENVPDTPDPTPDPGTDKTSPIVVQVNPEWGDIFDYQY